MTGQATAPPPAPAEAAPSEEEPTGRLARLGRLQALQIIIVLAVIVVVFAILKPSSFLTVFNIRGIVQNTAILAVLGVGMTFVIITGGIDLSVGSVLVFSGVVADKAMAAIGGGQGWGSALIGALVAIGCGFAWGLLNGFLVARAKVPPLIVTLGTLGHGPGPGRGDHRRRGPAQRPDRHGQLGGIRQHRLAGPHPGRHRRGRHRDRDRDPAPDPVRVVHLRARIEPRGRPAFRHQRQPSPDQGLRPVRPAGRLRRLAQPGVLPVDHDRRPDSHQPQRDRRHRDRRHQLVRRLRVHLRHHSSACSSRPRCRTDS